MNVIAFLRTTKDVGNIRFRINHAGKSIYASSDIEIKKAWWDEKKECVKASASINVQVRKSVNERVIEIKERIFNEYYAGRMVLSTAWLQKQVNRSTGGSDFIEKFKEFGDRTSLSYGRKKAYRCLIGKLERYMDQTGCELSFTISDQEFESVVEFIRNEPGTNRSENYILDNIKMIRAFFTQLKKEGVADRVPRIDHGPAVYSDPVALTIEEVECISNKDLPKRLETFRDMFVLHCHIGARVSDFVNLRLDNISDGVLTYIAGKTSKQHQHIVRVPLSSKALAIIEKYKRDDGRIFPFMNINGANGYNKMIKKVLRECGIDRLIPVLDPDTGTRSYKRMCDIVTSHTARKTFISCVLNTTKSDVITASMTGHQDMSVFRRYTDIRQDTLKDVIDKTFKR